MTCPGFLRLSRGTPERQPPLPPLNRGAKKENPTDKGARKKAPQPVAGVAFSYPPNKGGVGGVAFLQVRGQSNRPRKRYPVADRPCACPRSRPVLTTAITRRSCRGQTYMSDGVFARLPTGSARWPPPLQRDGSRRRNNSGSGRPLRSR